MNRVLIIFLLFISSACERQLTTYTNRIEETNIAVRWEIVENGCEGKDRCTSKLTLINKGAEVLDTHWELYFNHTFCREIFTDSLPAGVKIVHINGDFYKLIPTNKFKALAPGEEFAISILSSYAATKYSDAPGGFYFVFRNPETKQEIIKEVTDFSIGSFTKENHIHRNKNDHFPLPTAEAIFMSNQQLSLVEEEEIGRIIPSPVKISVSPDSLALTSDFEIHYGTDSKEEAFFLGDLIYRRTGLVLKKLESSAKGPKIILVTTQPLSFTRNKEGYRLIVNKQEGILISGNTNAGVFYGIQSLQALWPIEKRKILFFPVVEVIDYPEFEYRGMMLDVARNFQTKKNVLKLIDLLSFYKLNKLSLQIADDEGWRLEIPGLPELTEIGSRRGHTLNESDRLIPSYGSGAYGLQTSANGFYSKEEYIEIVRYAKQRHIEVIPQIDLPGHARAAIKAMNVRYSRYLAEGNREEANKYLLRDLRDSSVYKSVQKFNDNVICPCQEGVYNFVTHLSKELIEMHRSAGVPLSTLQVGGDEVPEGVWEKSHLCNDFMQSKRLENTKALKQYFFERVFSILQKQNLIAGAYEDVSQEYLKEKNRYKSKELLTKDKVLLYSWNNVWGWGNEEASYRLANSGFPIVLGHVTNLYLDLAYTNLPEDAGQYWGGFNDTRKGFEYTPYNIYNAAYFDVDGNPLPENTGQGKEKLTALGRSSIKGLQGFLFSETLKDTSMMEYFVFPKIMGMAERAWSATPAWASEEQKQIRLNALNKDWNRFANTIGRRELRRLDDWQGGIGYYLPAPGAIIKDGYLNANISFPGLTIRYTTDGSDPDRTSLAYQNPLKVSGDLMKLASFSSTGRRSTVISVVVK